MTEAKDDLTYERVAEALRYEPDTGRFFWKESRGCAKKGDEAGCWSVPQGITYLVIAIDGKMYKAHRLAYLLMTGHWPKDQIDHRDGNGANNRWENIRAVTSTENVRNTKRRNNNSGFRGISWDRGTGKWRVRITNKGQRYVRGYFTELEDAILERLEAEAEIWGYHPSNLNA